MGSKLGSKVIFVLLLASFVLKIAESGCTWASVYPYSSKKCDGTWAGFISLGGLGEYTGRYFGCDDVKDSYVQHVATCSSESDIQSCKRGYDNSGLSDCPFNDDFNLVDVRSNTKKFVDTDSDWDTCTDTRICGWYDNDCKGILTYRFKCDGEGSCIKCNSDNSGRQLAFLFGRNKDFERYFGENACATDLDSFEIIECKSPWGVNGETTDRCQFPPESQFCQIGCGSDDDCDGMLIGDVEGAILCAANCKALECGSEDVPACTHDSSQGYTCIYDSEWKWKANSRGTDVTYVDSSGVQHVCDVSNNEDVSCIASSDACDDVAGYMCVDVPNGKWITDDNAYVFNDGNVICDVGGGENTCDHLCETATVGTTKYGCSFTSEEIPKLRWVEISSTDLYFDVTDSDGSTLTLCSAQTQKKVLGSECQVEGNFVYYNGEWIQHNTVNYAKTGENTLCINEEEKTCDSTTVCNSYDVDGTTFYCMRDSEDFDTLYFSDNYEDNLIWEDTDDSSHYICSGGDEIKCEFDTACTNVIFPSTDENLNYQCVYDSGWKWIPESTLESSTFGFEDGRGVFREGSDKAYLCLGSYADGEDTVEVEYCPTLDTDRMPFGEDTMQSDSCLFEYDVNSGDFYTCFYIDDVDGGEEAFWVKNKAYYNEESKSFLCPTTESDLVTLSNTNYRPLSLCDGNEFLCLFKQTLDETTPGSDIAYFVCKNNGGGNVVEQHNVWVLAGNDGAFIYYPEPLGYPAEKDSVICTTNLGPEESCWPNSEYIGNTFGLYCGDTQSFDDGDLIYKVNELCYSYLGTKDFVCTEDGWSNSYSPDKYGFQCPIPINPDESFFKQDASSPFLIENNILVLDGDCYSEGPLMTSDTKDITLFTYDLSSGDVTFKLANVLRGSQVDCTADAVTTTGISTIFCGTENQNVGEVRLETQNTASGDYILTVNVVDGIFNVSKIGGTSNIDKLEDYLKCVKSTNTLGLEGNCNVHGETDDGLEISVIGNCYQDNIVGPNKKVYVYIEDNEFEYQCDSDTGYFIQNPILTINEKVLRDPDTLSKGDLAYYINKDAQENYGDSESESPVYYFEYYPDLQMPFGFDVAVDKEKYMLTCGFEDFNSLKESDHVENILAPGVKYLFKFDEELKDMFLDNKLTFYCTISGPTNELSSQGDVRLWNFKKDFVMEDVGAKCASDAHCFGKCVHGESFQGRCSQSDLDCNIEYSWKQIRSDWNSQETFKGICESCGGYFVPEGTMNLYYNFHVQTNFSKLFKYVKNNDLNNGNVKLSSTGILSTTSPLVVSITEDSGTIVKFKVGEYEWGIDTANGNALSLNSSYSRFSCTDDVIDVCRDGIKIIDLVNDLDQDTHDVKIYTSEEGYCVGNQLSEVVTCSDTRQSNEKETTKTDNILYVNQTKYDSSNFGFEIKFKGVTKSPVTCTKNNYGKWGCSRDAKSLDKIELIDEVNSNVREEFKVVVNDGTVESSKTFFIICSPGVTGLCTINSKDVIPKLDVDEVVTTSVDGGGNIHLWLNKTKGGEWKCVSDGSSFFWIPENKLVVLDSSLVFDTSFPYDFLKYDLSFEIPEWYNSIDDITYHISSLDCYIGDSSIETLEEGCQDNYCTVSSDTISREEVVDFCNSLPTPTYYTSTFDSPPDFCNLPISCIGNLEVRRRGDQIISKVSETNFLGNMKILFDDSGKLCYSSDDCLGTCDVNVNYDFMNGEYNVELDTTDFGICLDRRSDETSGVCYAGNYIEDIFSEVQSESTRPFSILCDEHERNSFCCDSNCDYTCYWNASRILFKNFETYLMSESEKSTFNNCDADSGENYTTCRDCCEAPIYSDSCDFFDLGIRYYSGVQSNYCGIKNETIYSQIDSIGRKSYDRTCFESCGSSTFCDGKTAGGILCSEACLQRNIGSYKPYINIFGDSGFSLEDGISFQSCNVYDVCFDIPFDPHCSKEYGENCVLHLEGSPYNYPLLVGNTLYDLSSTENFEIKEEDVIVPTSSSHVWRICSSDSNKLRIIPSDSILEGKGLVNISYKFTLYSSVDDVTYSSPNSYETFQSLAYTTPTCSLSGFCLEDSECSDFNPNSLPDCQTEGETDCNRAPQCLNYRCSDSNARGAFFSIVLKEDYDDFSDLSDEFWNTCSLDNCDYLVDSCHSYFLGIEIPQEMLNTFSTGVSNLTISTGFNEENYEISPLVAGSNLVSSLEGGLISVPGTVEGNKDLYVTLRDDEGNELFSSAGLVLNGASFQCSSFDIYDVDATSDVALSVEDVQACYSNNDCMGYTSLVPNEVSSCMKISPNWKIKLNNYQGGYNYNFVKICTDTCGVDIDRDGNLCDFNSMDVYGNSLKVETPSNCNDCCSEYGTGYPKEYINKETGVRYYHTCYANCVGEEDTWICDGVALGDVVDDGTGICGFKGSGCSYIQDRTEIDDILLSADDYEKLDKPRGSSSWPEYEFWLNYSDVDVIFDFSDDMFEDVPDDFAFVNDIDLKLKGYSDDGVVDYQSLSHEGIDFNDYTVKLEGLLSKKPFGNTVYELLVQQMNRRPILVNLTFNLVYPSKTEIIFPDSTKSCFYRSEDSIGTLCNYYSNSLMQVVYSVDASGEVDESLIDLSCKIDDEPLEVGGNWEEISTTDSRFVTRKEKIIDVSSLSVGHHLVSCEAEQEGFTHKSFDKFDLLVFGKIADVDSTTPTEIIPGKSYSVSLLKISDEFGKTIPFFTYSWVLKQGAISIPFGQTDRVEIPYNLEEGDAELILKVYADYFTPATFTFPVKIKIPQQISLSLSPNVVYVPLRGAEDLNAKILLSNSGLDAEVLVSSERPPRGVSVNVSKKSILVSGFDSSEVPISLTVVPSTSEKDFSVNFDTYIGNKFQDSGTLRIVQTNQPIYEFDVSGDLVLDSQLDLINDDVEGYLTLMNVGTVSDSYVVSSELPLEQYEFSLDALAQSDIKFTAKKEGNYQVCVRSIRFLDKEPRCIPIEVVRREVTPSISAENQEIQINPKKGGSFRVNLTTSDYSGKYVMEFESDLIVDTYEVTVEEGLSELISIPFTTTKSGEYIVKIKTYPEKYPAKFDETEFKLDVMLPAPYEVELMLDALEKQQITDSDLLNSIELAKLKMSEGNFEEAKSILEAASKEFARIQKLASYKTSATYMKPTKTYTFAVIGGLVIAAGIVLYLK